MQDYTHLVKITRGDLKPTKGHVYVMFSADGVAIYVGRTIQPLAIRLRGHYQDNPAKLWATAVLEAEELPVEALAAAEAELIHKYHPPLNNLCPMPRCMHYQGQRVTRAMNKGEIQVFLSDSALADTVQEYIQEARDNGEDRIFSADLTKHVVTVHPDHNLKVGQIRQKIKAAIGLESTTVHDVRTSASGRGWYLDDV